MFYWSLKLKLKLKNMNQKWKEQKMNPQSSRLKLFHKQKQCQFIKQPLGGLLLCIRSGSTAFKSSITKVVRP